MWAIILGLLVLLGIIAVIVLASIAVYNGLVRTRLESESAWSQIDVQLKRRYDLILNLVETVKGYATHERETLERVIKARQQAIDVKGIKEQAQAEGALLGALRQLLAVSEAYPDLKANQNFMSLQGELSGTENRISFARQYYNDTVTRYNTQLQVFPNNLLAGMFGFVPREFFELEATSQREAPKVQF